MFAQNEGNIEIKMYDFRVLTDGSSRRGFPFSKDGYDSMLPHVFCSHKYINTSNEGLCLNNS